MWQNEQGIGWEHLPEPPEDPDDGITWELLSTGSLNHGHRRTEPPDQLGRWPLASMEPAARSQLAGEMARHLRASQAQRIRANLQPDGNPMAPRKPQPKAEKSRGACASNKMFFKISNHSWLKARANEHQAVVEFVGTNRLPPFTNMASKTASRAARSSNTRRGNCSASQNKSVTSLKPPCSPTSPKDFNHRRQCASAVHWPPLAFPVIAQNNGPMQPTPTELQRLIDNLIRIGTVTEVRSGECRVKTGDLITNWRPLRNSAGREQPPAIAFPSANRC